MPLSTDSTDVPVLREILAWSRKLPPWQSDAVRRIFTQGQLSAEDESELFAMFLGAHGVHDGEKRPPEPSPFSELVRDQDGPARQVILKEIHSVSGVNALISEQSIKFALDGLTIVYGENGSGKTGYVRIFKHAFSARDKGPRLVGDVQSTRTEPATAVIELSVNGEDRALYWSDNSSMCDFFSEITVFDSHCALSWTTPMR
jgi:hypothetical protein